jgi:uncharacterized protein (DUF697 family)
MCSAIALPPVIGWGLPLNSGNIFSDVTTIVGYEIAQMVRTVSLSVLAVNLVGTVLSVALPTLAGIAAAPVILTLTFLPRAAALKQSGPSL